MRSRVIPSITYRFISTPPIQSQGDEGQRQAARHHLDCTPDGQVPSCADPTSTRDASCAASHAQHCTTSHPGRADRSQSAHHRGSTEAHGRDRLDAPSRELQQPHDQTTGEPPKPPPRATPLHRPRGERTRTAAEGPGASSLDFSVIRRVGERFCRSLHLVQRNTQMRTAVSRACPVASHLEALLVPVT